MTEIGARKSNAGRATLNGPLNILLLGTDRRKSWSSWQSDTIIMVHVPKEHDRDRRAEVQRGSGHAERAAEHPAARHRPAEELELVAVRHDHHGPRTEGA